MIQCTHCGTKNRDGSKFCSDCGARLVQQSGLVCPMCGTPNTVDNVFCSKCGARLAPLTVAPVSEKTPPPMPIKGLSLPAKPAEPVAPAAKTEPSEPVAPVAKAEPEPAPAEPKSGDWLGRLRALTPEEESPTPPSVEPATEARAPESEPLPSPEETSGWLARLRAAPPAEEQAPVEPIPPRASESVQVAEEDLPDWLRSTSPPVAQELAQDAAPASKEATPSWMLPLGAEVEQQAVSPTSSDDDIPEWLKSTGTPSATEHPAPSDDKPDWFKSGAIIPPMPPPVQATEAEIPDWLKTLKPKEELPIAPIADFPLSPEETVTGVSPQVESPGEELLEALEAAAPSAEVE
ncbi:MAG: zinc-ribbon domain-containing protein, partial [Anaerolineales bacterium]|nr:zinc-ribbon domain-containing protein [Anaerolineales bacterium]